MADKDYYDILGVPKTATADEIKKAVRKAAAPSRDRSSGPPAAPEERRRTVSFVDVSPSTEIALKLPSTASFKAAARSAGLCRQPAQAHGRACRCNRAAWSGPLPPIGRQRSSSCTVRGKRERRCKGNSRLYAVFG